MDLALSWDSGNRTWFPPGSPPRPRYKRSYSKTRSSGPPTGPLLGDLICCHTFDSRPSGAQRALEESAGPFPWRYSDNQILAIPNIGTLARCKFARSSTNPRTALLHKDVLGQADERLHQRRTINRIVNESEFRVVDPRPQRPAYDALTCERSHTFGHERHAPSHRDQAHDRLQLLTFLHELRCHVCPAKDL